MGQETADAALVDDAIEIARQLSQTLDMPRRPGAMSIVDSDGHEFYSHKFDRSGDLWMKGHCHERSRQ